MRQTPLAFSDADRFGFALLLTFYFVPLVITALLAWRNLRVGRGDRRCAFRLALFVALFCVHLTVFFPVTTELSAWYAGGFILDLLVLVALVLHGFRTSLAGQPLLGGRFLDD